MENSDDPESQSEPVPSESTYQFSTEPSFFKYNPSFEPDDGDTGSSEFQFPDNYNSTSGPLGSGESSLFRLDAKDSKGVVLLVSRKVTVTYGPYMTLGNMDYGVERLQGIIQVLQQAGADVILKPSYHYNEVRVWHLENMIYSCKITDLQYAVDGDLDHRALEAGKALLRSTRRAHGNLKQRYKSAEKIMAKCPCHPDYVEPKGGAGLIERIKMSDRARRESESGVTSVSGSSSCMEMHRNPFPHFFHPELYREVPVRKADKERSRLYGILNQEDEVISQDSNFDDMDEDFDDMIEEIEAQSQIETKPEIEYEAYTPKPKSKKQLRSRAFSIAQGVNRGFVENKTAPALSAAIREDEADAIERDHEVGVEKIMEQVATVYNLKQH